MPDGDGLHLYRTLEARGSHLVHRIAFCSRGLFTDETREFLEATDCPLLQKPVSREVVNRTIARLLIPKLALAPRAA